MMKNSYIIFILIAFISCNKKEESHKVIPGVIFSKEQTTAEYPFLKNVTAWNPTNSQVVELEDSLKSYIQTFKFPGAIEIVNNLPKYKRQYLGIVENGKNLIFVNAFCESYKSIYDSTNTHFVFVFDGGSCFFQLKYDPFTKTFSQFSVNGVA